MRKEEGMRGEDEVRVAEEEECAGKGQRNGSKEQTYLHQWWPVAYVLYISQSIQTQRTHAHVTHKRCQDGASNPRAEPSFHCTAILNHLDLHTLRMSKGSGGTK